jgi:sugar lactone lactonase YvrE
MLNDPASRNQLITAIKEQKELGIKSPESLIFMSPAAVAVGNRGDLFVIDSGKDQIYSIGNDSAVNYQFGGFGNGPGQFNQPFGLALDKAGNIFVTDRGNNRVQKFDSRGNFLLSFGEYGHGDGQFDQPAGVGVDAFGYIFIVDTGNNRVQRFNSQGGYIGQFGNFGWGDGFFNAPVGLAIGPDNTIYITDTGNGRIERFNTNGSFIAATESIPLACGISVDGSGAVYFLDVKESKLGVFPRMNRNPEYIKGDYDVKIYGSSQITLDATGKKVYLWDPGERKIHILNGE